MPVLAESSVFDLIERGWTFIFEPLLLLACLLLVCRTLAPGRITRWVKSWIKRAKVRASDRETRRVLSSLGLGKLAPLFALVVVSSILYVGKEVVFYIGGVP